MKKILSLMILLLPIVASAGPTVETAFDLRVRQEVLEKVYFFAPDSDQNWIRVRPRLTLGLKDGHHGLQMRLTNEHRHYITPDQDFDEDEVIVDRLAYTWRGKNTNLTIGRQDIIWNHGFLMLDGHPLDGSRSIYHNAIRLRRGGLDVAAIYNLQQDDLVLYKDQDRLLSDMDEIGLAAKYDRGPNQFSLIFKDEKSADIPTPSLRSTTFAWRHTRQIDCCSSAFIEVALQNQRYSDQIAGTTPLKDGWPMALQMQLDAKLRHEFTGEFGAFYYAGANESHEAFRTPWGKWPKWSELYIYALIGDGRPGDGRVNVGSWENISAPYVTLRRPVMADAVARLSVYQLMSETPSWDSRGTLVQTELKFLLMKNLSGHLLWEALIPGDYYDGMLDKTAHFLRWQLTYSL
jgi:hypothetical protein